MRVKERDPYSRVYWRAIDDPKFAHVWDDDHALAAWLRLLVAADMAWPASATLYHGIRKSALKALTDAGLVDMQTGGRYRIHGLDKERNARSDAARRAANFLHHGNADGVPPLGDEDWSDDAGALHPQDFGSAGRSAETVPSQDEQSKDETRRAKPSKSNGARPPADAFDVMLVVEDLTRSRFGYREGHQIHDTLVADVGNHGAAAIAERYRAFRATAPGPVDAAQLVFGVHNALHPLVRSKPLTDQERKDAEMAAFVAAANGRAGA